MAAEIRLRAKYRIGGSAKKTKGKAGGNSGAGKALKNPPRGLPKVYRGKTRG